MAPLLLALAHLNPSSGGGEISFVVAIFAEAALLAFLCRKTLRPWPLFGAWTGITTVTWILLIAALLPAMRDLLGKDRSGWESLIVVELLVVGIEGFILALLSRAAVLRKPGSVALSGGAPFFLSFTVNLISFWFPLLLPF